MPIPSTHVASPLGRPRKMGTWEELQNRKVANLGKVYTIYISFINFFLIRTNNIYIHLKLTISNSIQIKGSLPFPFTRLSINILTIIDSLILRYSSFVSMMP